MPSRPAKRAPEVLETIVAADIVASWRHDFGIDVSGHFDGIRDLRLCRDRATGRIYFDPPVVGTPDFYRELRSFDWYQPTSKAEHQAAARYIGPRDRILDIGAGTGAFAEHVKGADYHGLEFDSRGADQGRALGRDVSGQDLTEIAEQIAKGGRQSYSVITAFQVLEHFPDPDDFVDTALRCLAPEGYLILGLPGTTSYLSALPDFVLNAPPHHLTWWSAASLGSLLRRHGLQDLAIQRFPVESWERRLWWMARTARLLSRGKGPRFGRRLRHLKLSSWLTSGLLQAIRPPANARGATLLAIGRKPREHSVSGAVDDRQPKVARRFVLSDSD